MAAPSQDLTVLERLTGFNDTDPPWALPSDLATSALNVEWYQATLARKRTGATTLSLTFSSGGPFTGVISSLTRHVPGADETLAELWAIDDAATPIVGRLAGGTTWTAPTLKDALSGNAQDAVGVSFNGKLFLAYKSAQDRLHVWDTSTVRRVGLPTSGVCTVANTGSGSYAATIRYYKITFTEVSGATIVRRSELSTAVSFTPSGSGTAARVTIPTLPNEGETHWEVWGSADNSSYFRLVSQVVGTTTYDDSTNPSAYSGTAAPASGTNTVPTSAKYLFVADSRLLLAGGWATGALNSRVWFTSPLGASNIGDDERIPSLSTQSNYVDLDENNGGGITGFGGIYGTVYVFKTRQIWRLVPTGDATAPYTPFPISKHIGALRQQTVVLADDEAGSPSLYFLSHRGPYRVVLGASGTGGGLQYLGHDWQATWSTVNLAASTVVAHGVYHADRHQVWWWVATGSSNDPDTKLVYDIELGTLTEATGMRRGWAKHTGPSAAARCSAMFSTTVGASMSRALKPYIGRASGTAIWQCDSGATSDAGTTFAASVTTRPFAPRGLGRNAAVGQASVLAGASAATVTLTLVRDFGLESRTSTASLAASGSETRVQRQFEGSAMGNGGVVQATIGDGAAQTDAWVLDALILPLIPHEQR